MPIRLPRIGRSQSPVGVEIGSDAVRMLQTTAIGSDRIRRVAVVPRSADGSIDAQRLRRAWRGFSSFDAVVSLDDDCVDVRPGRLPRLSGEELRDAARWEIAGMLERDGADLVAESMSVGRDVAEDGRVEMLLIAADRRAVEERLDPLLEVGIRPIAVEPVFLAAGRAFAMRSRRDDEQEVVRVVVKTDEATTWISVMRGDGVVFAKSVPIGTRDFDQALATNLSIDLEDATRTRSDAARGEAEPLIVASIADAVRRASRGLIGEVAMAIRYSTKAARLSRPVGIHLAGIGASTPGLSEALGSGIPGVPVVGDSPTAQRLADLPATGHGSLAWATAFGLAIRPTDDAREAAA